MITALCGGVGGSKLVSGLYHVLPADTLSVIVNTADDLEFCGLHVSPDLDTVTYTLAGVANHKNGWGIEADTFHARQVLERYGAPAWFQVGDRDLATDIYRTWQLRSGETLTAIAAAMASSLGVRARILPMTDDPVSTELLAQGEWLPFQDYFVRRRHQDEVQEIRYVGVADAKKTVPVLDAIAGAGAIVIVNSNPLLSIWPILSLDGFKESLQHSAAVKIAVSPMIGEGSITGPAGRLMALAGEDATSLGVARLYRDLIGAIVIDRRDEGQAREIEDLGIRVFCTDIVMRNPEDQARLAREVLTFVAELA